MAQLGGFLPLKCFMRLSEASLLDSIKKIQDLAKKECDDDLVQMTKVGDIFENVSFDKLGS